MATGRKEMLRSCQLERFGANYRQLYLAVKDAYS